MHPRQRILLKAFFLDFIIITCLITGFLPSVSFADSKQSDKLALYTVNYPLKYFAERIAGEHATVVFPPPADEDPAFWMPATKIILDYQNADLILLNGADYAKWVNKVSLPQLKLVNTSSKFSDQYIAMEDIITHTHGPTGEHAHTVVAFTTWLDFDFAIEQAKAITKALSRKRSELKDIYQRNYKELEKDLMTADRDIKAIVENNQNRPLVASHPVYQYFKRRYNLNIKSVHWEPEQMPGEKQWADLQNILKSHPAKWMIWESEPKPSLVERLKSMGVNSLVFDPCGNTPEEGDFMVVMRRNIENLKLAFKN